ncbi:hypothetical protein ATANTOWER_009994 [Ataeniobius toweri]|uniref:Uncharacterized protein n=1 Tax=Ataeniobius toweri TaxID=208326 RepID=A0ABU7CFR6_9TELE|nr:hypothetical protein [Ataeniobius toweri]
MCLRGENPARTVSPCYTSKSISHSLTSLPLWSHSFIALPVVMTPVSPAHLLHLKGAVNTPQPLKYPLSPPLHYHITKTAKM